MRVPIGAVIATVAGIFAGGGLWYCATDRHALVDGSPREQVLVAQVDGPASDVTKYIQCNHRLAAKLYGKLSAAAEADANLVCAPAGVLATLATMVTAEKTDAELELRQALDLKIERDKLKGVLTSLAAQFKKDVSASHQTFVGLHIDEPKKGVVRVKEIVPDSLAALAGFKVGDRIVSIRMSDGPGLGVTIQSAADFVHALDEAPAIVRVRCQPANEEQYVTRRLRLIGQKKSAATPDRELQLRTMETIWHPADDTPPGSMLVFAEETRGVGAQGIDFASEAKRVRLWFGKRLKPEREVTLPSKALPANLRTAFTCAVSFQADWAEPVHIGPVREIPFKTGERKSKVPAIPFTGRFHVSKNADYQTVELPCVGSLAMVFVVPVKSNGLAALEKSLSATSWQKMLGAGDVQDATLVVPEFDLVSRNDLRETLGKLGMSGTFASGPRKGRLAPSTILQQVQARVLRENTGAKAPTEAAKPIVADHGFMFLVYNRRTQEILVLGRLVDPRAF